MKSQIQFEQFKEATVKSEPFMRKVNLADISIVDEKTIKYAGRTFNCSEQAINDFAKIVGFPVTFGNSIQTAFGKEVKQKIADLQKAARVLAGKNPTVTLVADRNFGIIVRMLQTSNILPYEMYFDVFDRMMNGSKMEITDFGSSSDGGVFINTTSRESEFKVGKFKDETFHPGTTFSNNMRTGAVVDSFVSRLVCSNGMVTKGFGSSINYNPENVNEFFSKLSELKSSGFLPSAFNDKVAAAISAKASYAEVKNAAHLLKNSSKISNEFVDKFVPVNDIRRKFQAKGCDVSSWNSQQEKTAITNISVWDVVNGVTDFASHDYGFELSQANRLNLQVQAGNLLSNDFDTQNLVHISL